LPPLQKKEERKKKTKEPPKIQRKEAARSTDIEWFFKAVSMVIRGLMTS
jgi:hypothetical protein